MIIVWSTQCPKCGPLLIREAQRVSGGITFGETWCCLCGSPVTEMIERRAEKGEEPMPPVNRPKKDPALHPEPDMEPAP